MKKKLYLIKISCENEDFINKTSTFNKKQILKKKKNIYIYIYIYIAK